MTNAHSSRQLNYRGSCAFILNKRRIRELQTNINNPQSLAITEMAAAVEFYRRQFVQKLLNSNEYGIVFNAINYFRVMHN